MLSDDRNSQIMTFQSRVVASQGATAGQMPPSDSDDSDEDKAPKEPVGMLAGVWPALLHAKRIVHPERVT